jgi:hypothetical protein
MPNIKRGRGERDKSLGLANGPWEVHAYALLLCGGQRHNSIAIEPSDWHSTCNMMFPPPRQHPNLALVLPLLSVALPSFVIFSFYLPSGVVHR